MVTRTAGCLAAGRLVTPDTVHAPGWVRWRDGVVVDVGAGPAPVEPDLRLPDATVVPGFVDTHVHGGGGASFGPDPEQALTAIDTHLRHGTTTMVASLVTATPDELERSVRSLAELVRDGALAGIHLEGPWLSPHRRGAHAPELLHAPEPEEVERLLRAGDGTVTTVTVAPELDHGLDAVRRIAGHGAIAAVGHTDATYDTTRAALDAGARLGTHLFNAMRPIHHREPGPAVALSQHGDAVVEVIADGVHLHPAMIRVAATGAAPLVLVTDAMAAAGQPDGDYRLGALDVTVKDGQARLREGGSIAGSTLTLDAAVRHTVDVADLPLLDAVRAATTTPADLIGRPDLGRLAPGARADLVVLDDRLHVTGVVREGTWVVEPARSRTER